MFEVFIIHRLVIIKHSTKTFSLHFLLSTQLFFLKQCNDEACKYDSPIHQKDL